MSSNNKRVIFPFGCSLNLIAFVVVNNLYNPHLIDCYLKLDLFLTNKDRNDPIQQRVETNADLTRVANHLNYLGIRVSNSSDLGSSLAKYFEPPY